MPGAGGSSPHAPNVTKGGRQASPHRKVSKHLNWELAVNCRPKARVSPDKGAQGHQGLETHCQSSLVGNTVSFGYIHFDLTTAFSLDIMFQKPLSGFAS